MSEHGSRGADPAGAAGDPLGSAREEAERLVAAALAAAQLAARRLGGDPSGMAASLAAAAGHLGAKPGESHQWGIATGEPQCCVCPICRVIAAMRDPSPELAERLATGAGDFAVGLASLLRSLGQAAGQAGARVADAAGGHGRGDGDPADPDSVWRAATRTAEDEWPARRPPAAAGTPGPAAQAAPVAAQAPAAERGAGAPRTPMAKKAVKKALHKAAAEPPVSSDRAVRKAAKKAVAKKAAGRKAPGHTAGGQSAAGGQS